MVTIRFPWFSGNEAACSAAQPFFPVDMSARIQTVDEERHGRYYRLLKEFKKQTGCGVVINTSFNIRGEPIVCTPQDAYQCFMATDMDVLVLENCLVYKHEQPPSDDHKKKKYVDSFNLD